MLSATAAKFDLSCKLRLLILILLPFIPPSFLVGGACFSALCTLPVGSVLRLFQIIKQVYDG